MTPSYRTHRVELPIRKPSGQYPDDRPSEHISRMVPVVHGARDGHERRAADRRKEDPRLPGVSSSVRDAHFCASAGATAWVALSVVVFSK